MKTRVGRLLQKVKPSFIFLLLYLDLLHLSHLNLFHLIWYDMIIFLFFFYYIAFLSIHSTFHFRSDLSILRYLILFYPILLSSFLFSSTLFLFYISPPNLICSLLSSLFSLFSTLYSLIFFKYTHSTMRNGSKDWQRLLICIARYVDMNPCVNFCFYFIFCIMTVCIDWYVLLNYAELQFMTLYFIILHLVKSCSSYYSTTHYT